MQILAAPIAVALCGLTAAPLSAEASSRPADGVPSGRIAVLHEPGMPCRGIPSSPSLVAAVLGKTGAAVRLLSADELARPDVLDATAFDIVVLPSGEGYPIVARESLIGFLKGGGSLITMGGYALNDPMRRQDGHWQSETELRKARYEQATRKESSLLTHGDFEGSEGLSDAGRPRPGRWQGDGPRCSIVAEEPHEGRACAKVAVSSDTPTGGGGFWQDLPARPGAWYRVSGWLRAHRVNESGYAYIALYQYGVQDKLITFRDFAVARGTTEWSYYSFICKAEPAATRLSVRFGLYQTHGTAWFDDIRLADISDARLEPLNTATGKPMDGLVVAPEQIGIFDASFPLKRACRMRTAPGQYVVREPLDVRHELTGWAASGVVGYDHARWIPLLQTYDRYDRPRGAAAALLLNYAGFYAGSCWAYFGVDNLDLFGDPNGPEARALQEIAGFVLRKTFLRNLATEHRLCRPGERIRASVVVDNRGPHPQQVEVRFTLADAQDLRAIGDARRSVVLRPRSIERVEAVLPAVPASADLCSVTATLCVGDRPIDEMTTGVVAERPDVLKAGPALGFRDNYFTLNGRPMFLFGTDTYLYTYKSAHENPLTWADEHRAGRDIGLNLYENLQYVTRDYKFGKKDWLDFRAMAQLTQKHGLVFMPGLLIGHNVAIGDELLKKQSDLCAAYAENLRDTPGLLWYINGDYQMNLGDHPMDIRSLWNRWLTDRYGSTEKLRAAWGAAAANAELGNLDFWPSNTGHWRDAALVDRLRFQNWLTRRWNEAHVAALRGRDPLHPITSEYYQICWGGMDMIQTIDGLDVANFGFFGKPEEDMDILPLKIRFNDLRARGKGVALGEYGAKTHPAWSIENGATDYHIVHTEEQQKQLFLAVAHYGFGMGVCKVQNWCLRDAQDHVFPWGFFHPNQFIPKDVAYVHRNLSLLWRFFSPRYVAPPLTVCIPNNLRLGNFEAVGRTVADNTFETLLGLHYEFNVIDDDHLDQIPPETKTLVYPSPFALSDDTYDRLLAWVRAGGSLLVTGDISYDENRRRTRTARLKELCGVEFVRENYPDIARRKREVPTSTQASRCNMSPSLHPNISPSIDVKALAAKPIIPAGNESPVFMGHLLGNGGVIYFTDPMELATDEPTASLRRKLYSSMVRLFEAKALDITPDEPWLHVMRQRTARGNVHVIYNCRKTQGFADVTIPTEGGNVHLSARNRYPALIAVSDQRKVVAVEADGRATTDAGAIMTGAGQKALLSLDGEDLATSKAILVAPFEAGTLAMPLHAQTLAAVVGDFRDGRWITLERAEVKPKKALPIDADRATCLILLCTPGSEARWGDTLTQAMLRPDLIDGY